MAKYEVIRDGVATVEMVPAPATLFPRALLHTSTIVHLLTSKFDLGVPHFRLEREFADQGAPLDRGTMCRYKENAGNTFGATIVHAMWRHVLATAQVISTDATGALNPNFLPCPCPCPCPNSLHVPVLVPGSVSC